MLLLLLAACVERKLHVRTIPSGAIVKVNGERIGTSPASWRFDHYGKVLVEAELPGYEREQRVVRLKTPGFQRPVVDFFTDVVYPGTIHDDHEVLLKLRPLPDLTEDRIARTLESLARAARARRAEASRR